MRRKKSSPKRLTQWINCWYKQLLNCINPDRNMWNIPKDDLYRFDRLMWDSRICRMVCKIDAPISYHHLKRKFNLTFSYNKTFKISAFQLESFIKNKLIFIIFYTFFQTNIQKKISKANLRFTTVLAQISPGMHWLFLCIS